MIGEREDRASPEVSVVLAVRDAVESIDATVESVLAQTEVELELVVVDDGSSDGTRERLADWGRSDARVRVETNPGRGLTAALVHGCAVATGRWIARQDAGDRSLPGRLSRQASILRNHRDVVLVSCWTSCLGPEREPLYEVRETGEPNRPLDVVSSDREARVVAGPSAHGSTMFRRETYLEAGGYREAFRLAQDWDLWLRLGDRGRFWMIGEALYERLLGEGSLSTRHRRLQRRFGELGREALRLRRATGDDAAVLRVAEGLAPALERTTTATDAALALYHVGEALRRRRDPRARGYLRRALRRAPWLWRAWIRAAQAEARNTMSAMPTLAIVVPTFLRERVLIETVDRLLALDPPARELWVVDQTPAHEPATEEALLHRESSGEVRRIRLPEPSIPRAMNAGLAAATTDLVLFVDDDVEPDVDLVGAHVAAHAAGGVDIVAGQVLQPGESAEALRAAPGTRFPFRSSLEQEAVGVMAGNLSVRRSFAIEIGGFDENFEGAAYCFEEEFAHRAGRRGARIRFVPAASLRHLRASAGGTRAHGHHLRSASPAHSVGEYYFLLVDRTVPGRWRRLVTRPLRAIATRHHLLRPWWIPVTLVAELRGLTRAIELSSRGPRTLATESPA